VLVAAGLVARKARERGLDRKPWVKTSLAPGSQVVTDYLDRAGLSEDLNAIGFDLVGYGCTTCIGNSGPLPEHISAAIHANDLVAASVLSGNRNFEGRVSPDVRANYLASPPLVVAYAIKGTVTGDMVETPIGQGTDGEDVYLRDIWPSNDEVRSMIDRFVGSDMFKARYADVYKGDERWQAIPVTGGDTYAWSGGSTYIQNPPYFEGMSMTAAGLTDIVAARPLAIFGDSITTDHISPAGAIKLDSPGGKYLAEHQVSRGRLQQLRRPPRQPRSDDARHLRQHPHQEPDDSRHRRRRHALRADRRGDADLRCGHALQGKRHAAGRHRRQGIWHRLVARLGGQGHQPAGRPAR
jgi:aconitate hydratase